MNVDGIYIRLIQKIRYMIASVKCLIIKKEETDLQKFSVKNGRLPSCVTKGLSRSVTINNEYPAGKRIEFETERTCLRFRVFYRKRRVLPHMSTTGTSGIDIYIKDDSGYHWKKCISPANELQMHCEAEVVLDKGKKIICIYYPSFAVIDHIFVNDEDVKLIQNPQNSIVIYGSSITHGCAATRPGIVYSNLLQRKIGYDVLNFGFSESARGELPIIRYIASLNAKIFILEFDHNSSVEELKGSHLNVYKAIREITDCWVILMSRFSGGLSISEEEEKMRCNIIKDTFEYAVSKLDKRITYINGGILFNTDKSNYFIDGVHPNDLGMHFIAERIANEIKEKGMIE